MLSRWTARAAAGAGVGGDAETAEGAARFTGDGAHRLGVVVGARCPWRIRLLAVLGLLCFPITWGRDKRGHGQGRNSLQYFEGCPVSSTIAPTIAPIVAQISAFRAEIGAIVSPVVGAFDETGHPSNYCKLLRSSP